MKTYLKESIIIVLVSILFATIRYYFITDDFDIIKKNKIADRNNDFDKMDYSSLESFIENISQPTFIDLSYATQIHNLNLATFIDARDVASYTEGHIKRAINLPYESIESIEKKYDLIWMIELGESYVYHIEDSDVKFIIGINNNQKFIKVLDNINSDLKEYETIFVIYCSGEGCSLSEDLAFYMSENLGFNKILIYEGGMPEWIDNGLPVE